MSIPVIKTGFVVGEVAPAMFGHVDLARMQAAASTMRNMWPSYHGGAYSRAGTKFVGFSKQTGRSVPPRLIPFQFSISQGLALEFGNYYMRVVSDGAFVTEPPAVITGISRANPAVVSFGAISATGATPNDGAVTVSYARGDTVTLAGGAFTTPAVIDVDSTKLVSIAINSPGASGYAPNDTINLAGGAFLNQAVIKVTHTVVVSVGVAAVGAGGTPGLTTLHATTGTGIKFQVDATIDGSGRVAGLHAVVVAGDYTVNPTNPAFEPVTAGPLTGAALRLEMGILQATIFSPGKFTTNSAAFTQAFTSGAGIGATFNTAVFGPDDVSIANPGVYTAFPANPVAQAATSGAGVGVTFNMTSASPSFNAGDWVYLQNIGGMTELNGDTVVVQPTGPATYQLFDVYGNPIDSTGFGAWTAGGTASRLYTLATPYAEADLEYLKFTQSADVMSITTVNQATGTEYAPQDLSRLSDSHWAFSPAVPAPSLAPPTGVAGTASAAGGVDYQYVVTAVSAADGSESIASAIAEVNAAVNISATAGTITLTWNGIAGINQFNIYKAAPGFGVKPPAGALFGYAGSAYGTQFLDSNIVADYAQVPPLHKNPFARGQVLAIVPVAGGAAYTDAAVSIASATGSGASFTAVIVGGAVVAYIQQDAGQNYLATDVVTVTSGSGAGATASIRVGPQSGTYPGVVAYFQERRAYGFTLNNPDTYFLSQPGAFTNFDSRIPPIDSDAIIGTPWSVQVNGIQFMLPMPGGLVVFTGQSVWQVNGGGSSSFAPQPITPSSQAAQPQSSIGCSATVPPIKIESDIIYVQAKNSNYLEAAYQIYTNNYNVNYLTLYSSHLFTGFTIREHAWCEEPNKLLWSMRSDGIALSLTRLKPQEVQGWARHDTQGLFRSVAQVTEPPVDALYLATQRYPTTWSNGQTSFMIERMDDRIWGAAETCWCVDAGLALAQTAPNATLTASSATGLGAISGVTALVGGANYSASTTAAVVDDNGSGPGVGAIPALTIAGGVITAISFAGHNGAGYTFPALVITDPTNAGSGASATLVLDNSMVFTASAAVFGPGNVGDVIRMGSGIADITAYTDPTHVTANICDPILDVLLDDSNTPLAAPAGSWTMTKPVASIGGLRHLAGLAVTGLADGNVIPPTVVDAAGRIALPRAASAVIAGLGFQVQLQGVYLETGEPTVQAQRKKIAAVTARLESSRGVKVGTNQVDGSTLSPPQIAPAWRNLADAPDKGRAAYNSKTIPLYTGDVRVPVGGGFATPGQVALQQDFPLPMQVLAIIPEMFGGDTPQIKYPDRKEKAA